MLLNHLMEGNIKDKYTFTVPDDLYLLVKQKTDGLLEFSV